MYVSYWRFHSTKNAHTENHTHPHWDGSHLLYRTSVALIVLMYDHRKTDNNKTGLPCAARSIDCAFLRPSENRQQNRFSFHQAETRKSSAVGSEGSFLYATYPQGEKNTCFSHTCSTNRRHESSPHKARITLIKLPSR